MENTYIKNVVLLGYYKVRFGASGMVARDIKLKLDYQKYLIDCENELLPEIYEDVMQSKAGDRNRTVSEYCGRLELAIWR